jgi:hypothetical protein
MSTGQGRQRPCENGATRTLGLLSRRFKAEFGLTPSDYREQQSG